MGLTQDLGSCRREVEPDQGPLGTEAEELPINAQQRGAAELDFEVTLVEWDSQTVKTLAPLLFAVCGSKTDEFSPGGGTAGKTVKKPLVIDGSLELAGEAGGFP